LQIINLKLASHPLNWITILLMLVIAGAIGHYVLALTGVMPATADGTTNLIGGGQLPAAQGPPSVTSVSNN
jgi:hypothetical protein